ncbi:MAG: DUF2789 domain-containing protein [Porticoccaceae bacterium]|nr:DUF2789 domain-containing protein [Porticoccaceae bacterium]OUS09971.1 hypothetical protein A9Q90_02215 [Gammaproteobacteria bacterium 54_18_T64]
MDMSPHTLATLFEQLGLPATESAIDVFIDQHSPLDPQLALQEAGFWNPGQRSFLIEALADDSDWTEMVEHLDAYLRR